MENIKKLILHLSIIMLGFVPSSQTLLADEYSADKTTKVHSPTAEQMIMDGLVYRPLSLAATAVGTGIFIVTLPFSLFGGNVEEAGNRLVVEPAAATFTECLGCIRHHRH